MRASDFPSTRLCPSEMRECVLCYYCGCLLYVLFVYVCLFIEICRFTISDELVHEKERYKAISEELDSTFQELSGY
ncbi:hypothetical protein Y032_0178g661 [Ancylostoma ceylanicum]|uniref:Uncharacterized protein n=1 Tax=Ancylostoma ceylanicum TaxID=53326 RepID=A0A016SU22_9BILA|nr:hypothetical protein Y032_0178g661 [Ancylostoma ceylanicum]